MYNLAVERGDLVKMIHKNFITGYVQEIVGIYLGIRPTRWSPDSSLVYVTILTATGIEEELASIYNPDGNLEVLQSVNSFRNTV